MLQPNTIEHVFIHHYFIYCSQMVYKSQGLVDYPLILLSMHINKLWIVYNRWIINKALWGPYLL